MANDLWNVIVSLFNSICAFLDWYLHETPLLKDTLDSLYVWVQKTYDIAMPIIAEYIQYITDYIHG